MPKHWPQGLELCNLRRVLWLPPGWGQAWKQDSKGFRRKMFVAPDTFGSKVVYFKSHVQDITGLDLQPVDHNGHPIPSRFPDHWPNWLPRDWEIGFAGFSSEFAPSFRSASGQVFGTEEKAKQHLKKLGISLKPVPDKKAKASPTGSGPGKARQRKPKQEPEEPERKSRRLRKLTAEECVVCEEIWAENKWRTCNFQWSHHLCVTSTRRQESQGKAAVVICLARVSYPQHPQSIPQIIPACFCRGE